jgi:hypothetical protein
MSHFKVSLLFVRFGQTFASFSKVIRQLAHDTMTHHHCLMGPNCQSAVNQVSMEVGAMCKKPKTMQSK